MTLQFYSKIFYIDPDKNCRSQLTYKRTVQEPFDGCSRQLLRESTASWLIVIRQTEVVVAALNPAKTRDQYLDLDVTMG